MNDFVSSCLNCSGSSGGGSGCGLSRSAGDDGIIGGGDGCFIVVGGSDCGTSCSGASCYSGGSNSKKRL